MLQNTRHEQNGRYLSVSATPPIIVFHTEIVTYTLPQNIYAELIPAKKKTVAA